MIIFEDEGGCLTIIMTLLMAIPSLFLIWLYWDILVFALKACIYILWEFIKDLKT